MPEITLPEVKLPDVKLPDGLREMNRHDIQAAFSERIPKKADMPDIDLSKVDLPKIDPRRPRSLSSAGSRTSSCRRPSRIGSRGAGPTRSCRSPRSSPSAPRSLRRGG